jgi:hypothetical protein
VDHEWEELQLYKNLTELVLHGLNLHRDQFFETNDVAALVRKSRDPVELDIDELYDSLLTEVARILVEIQKIAAHCGLIRSAHGSKRMCAQPTNAWTR